MKTAEVNQNDRETTVAQHSGRNAWIVRMEALAATLAVVCLASSAQAAPPRLPKVDIPEVELINTEISTHWKDFDLRPSPVEEDGAWCRRVFLDVLGRIPTYTELTDFMSDKSPDKREALVDRLLNDDKYVEDYASNWGIIWTNILVGRNGGLERDSFVNRSGMEKYLRDSFARNKPYNQMVYELITATGSTKPGTDNFNGATNFLVMKVNEDTAVQATAATGKIFLGLQVQCTQCHNHPFNQWKQQKFWEFNAFFRQSRALRRFVSGTRDIDHVELIDQDFGGEGGRPDEADVYYQLRNGLSKVAFPVFVDGTEIPRSGYVSEVNRRTELGKLVMQSDFMDKMIVNRMWSHFLGYGFTKPIDDLGPHNPASHPALLEELGKRFRGSSYDLKQLVKWITLSDAYQLSSRTIPANESDDPSLGEPPRFTHFYSRQMNAEDLYQSLIAASGAGARRGSLEDQQNQRNQWLRQFVIAFGTDEGDEATTFNGTIPQALMMFNGELINQAISLDRGSFLDQIANSNERLPEKINHLFMAGMARKAKPDELVMASKLLAARKGKVGEMLQDMWWAILNSNEFILNH